MKKYLIIFAALVVIIALVLLMLNRWFLTSSDVTSERSGSSDEAASGPVDLPGIGSQDENTRVENKNDSGEIKKAFENFTSQDVAKHPSYAESGISSTFTFDDNNGDQPKIETFFESVGANLKPEVKDLVGESYYALFYCPREGTRKDFGMVLELGSDAMDGLQKTNQDAKVALLKWEPFMLEDLHPILFPGAGFSEDQLEQQQIFRDGKFRYTEVALPNGEKSSINYVVDTYPPDHISSVSNIHIATSPECLQKSLESLFDF